MKYLQLTVCTGRAHRWLDLANSCWRVLVLWHSCHWCSYSEYDTVKQEKNRLSLPWLV